ncbi:rhodanese-like domain-containing protein [Lentilactobacillus sp. SPB1-3]|uniref:Rhodanese-like domain-containing protein n=1 Tax=Lentilactobacillus terminaliae TaxID=3003483 RepID=A0ACD5DG24_9LACO|nr:rhodanese-like domain-containing protein [Lentilactobacillus sp. SPB1-3]MCZ0976695.1 rhodanese-like domain-containing protein [Lentilactobacillus sp. SPB1-3]
METKKIELLETYLILYIDHFKVLESLKNPDDSDIVVLDVRNAPKQVKGDQIKGAVPMAAKDIADHLDELNPEKTYVVYDWTGGTTLGKNALLILLTHNFKAFELAGALEGWKGMNLPVEPAK